MTDGAKKMKEKSVEEVDGQTKEQDDVKLTLRLTKSLSRFEGQFMQGGEKVERHTEELNEGTVRGMKEKIMQS